ncbi:MAG: hypothetical protein AAFR04_01985 [Pseudomonadota bacterium]
MSAADEPDKESGEADGVGKGNGGGGHGAGRPPGAKRERVADIWIEHEEAVGSDLTQTEGDALDIRDGASEVIVTMHSGAAWIATFITYAHVMTLRRDHARNGAFLGGLYLQSADMVLIEDLSRDAITDVILDLIKMGRFEEAFCPIERDDAREIVRG